MTGAEAERAVRRLCREWVQLRGIAPPSPGNAPPSFGEFFRWLETRHAGCLDFRASVSVRFDVELWFDDETGQLWRR